VIAIRRLGWQMLNLLDLGLFGVLFYLFVPRRIRDRWARPGTVLRNEEACNAVRPLVADIHGAMILDVGGGVAAFNETLSDGSLRVVTLDIDMAMLQRARAKLAAPVLVRADGTRLPFNDDTFDAVVMVHALEHFPQEIRAALASEIRRVSRRGVVIHGPAGEDAVDLTRRVIGALETRGMHVPRYAREHLAFSMPMPCWFTETFPGCELQPKRNLQVELAVLLTAETPFVRWLGGFRRARMAALDDRPPFVEYTMTWKKAAADRMPHVSKPS